jgi:hypothetical protein
VRYNDDGSTGSTVTSDFSNYNEFVTDDSFALQVGDAFGGGYYAGQINDSGTIYNLIVAPKLSGTLEGESTSKLRYSIHQRTAPAATLNEVYGGPGCEATAIPSNESQWFTWLRDTATGPNAGVFDLSGASDGTGIGGFNDWYIPARYELEIMYRSLKPSTDANTLNNFTYDGVANGENAYAVPSATSAYSTTTPASNPAQTTSTLFQTGGTEAFIAPGGTAYGSSTQSPHNASGGTQEYLYSMYFNNGQTQIDDKNGSQYVRAIRRVAA